MSSDDPIYFHGDPHRKNVPVRSAKADRLKIKKVICAECNSAGTAPYDLAWEMFSAFVGRNWLDIKRTRRVKLQRVSPGKVAKSSVDLQLYFAKLFGCRIRADDIPIDLKAFSESLICRVAHPTCKLVFTIGGFGTGKMKYAGLSEVHTVNESGRSAFATWLYTLGEFHVQVYWNMEGLKTMAPKEAWLSSDGKIVNFLRK